MLHQIGAGALGPVFRAYEPDRDRLVAVKVFQLDLPPERVHQLVAELEQLITAGLHHSGIAAPFAAGIEGNSPYLAQSWVAADSLDVVLRDHGVAPPADALRLVVQLAGALDFAAVVKVHHGMLHPRDVLLSPDESCMTGLGVARALERAGVPLPVRRPYAPPERTVGARWDRRADVFSLAALAHEMLWGRRIAGIGAQAAAAITEIEHADLDAIRATFARALAEDPAQRFGTALEFAAALKSGFPGVEDQPVSTTGSVLPTADLDLTANDHRLTAEAERYQDIETAPAIVLDSSEPAAFDPPMERARSIRRTPSFDADSDAPIPMPPPGLLSAHEPETVSALERSRSAMWPLALALVVGIALGFGVGYGVGSRDQGVTTAGSVPTAGVQPPKPAPFGREWTETAVSEPPRAGVPAQANAPASVPATAHAPDAGRLLVRSTPAGARVFVDGRDVGSTPASIRDLARGAHRVRLVREGYATEERRVVISAAQPLQSMTVALARTRREEPPPARTGASYVGSLSVESRPAGATVYVDGKVVGKTPVVVPEIAAGTHVVRLDHDGYRRWSSAVRVVSGERNRVTASLER